jgi:signal transduction histidine kinase/response regulator RpfG family c-di-GMP phosphodiesterase
MKKPVIVCIDDEPAVLDSLKIELKRALGNDCIIETAEGGVDALELVRELQLENAEVALVLSDYIMPGIKGDELLGKIHQLSPQTLTIMLTGQADLTAVGNAIKSAKLYRYIPKPWHAEDLKITVLEAVHSYLQERKLAKQTVHLYQLNAELQETNQQLRDSKSRLTQFLDALPLGFAVYNLDGTILYLNETGKKLLGVKELCQLDLEPTNQSIKIYQVGTGEPYPYEELPIVQALQGLTVIRDDLEVIVNKQKIPLEIQAKPIFDSQDNILYAVSSFQDISERRLKEVAMQEATRSDEANRAKSAFLANMSHELRTPLNAILGFARVLLTNSSLKPEERQNVKVINRSGEHLLNLINQVLDLSKVEAGRVTLDLAACDLPQLILELREMFQIRAKEKGLHLKFQISQDTPIWIRTDEMKLRQVLINLLSNAIKFTSQGQVFLKVEALNAESLEFSIVDTGIGIAAEELDQLFQAFVQASTGRKVQGGTGLGLAISQEFVRLLGGEIEVKSELGQGSEFRFTLPIELIHQKTGAYLDNLLATSPTHQIISLAPGQPAYKLLVVDDEESSQKSLVEIFQPLGFLVQQAENGQEAISLCMSWEPHVIFMDLKMLLIDGYVAIKQIKSQQTTLNSNFPVIIALTSSFNSDQQEFALSHGFDDFICKPVQYQEILEMVGRHLGLEYIYGDRSRSTLGKGFVFPEDELTAFIPPLTWTSKIRQAIASQDWEAMEMCISEICQEDIDFAYSLQCHLDNSDYEAMLEVINDQENK